MTIRTLFGHVGFQGKQTVFNPPEAGGNIIQPAIIGRDQGMVVCDEDPYSDDHRYHETYHDQQEDLEERLLEGGHGNSRCAGLDSSQVSSGDHGKAFPIPDPAHGFMMPACFGRWKKF